MSARSGAGAATRTYDALVVGAGPSGAVAAKRLAEAGFDVVVLEQGDWPDYSTGRADHADYEVTEDRHWPWNPNRDPGGAGYPIDDGESDISALMWNGVGGSALVWAAQWQRLLPSDFRVRSLDGVADDWPLTYEDLEPYYVRAERDFAISGLANDPALPLGEGPPLPPVPLREFGRRVARGHNALGWHWWPGTNAIATRAYGGLNACTQRATCMHCCIEKAKSSPDLTHWPTALAHGAALITGARTRRIVLDERGRAAGALYTDRAGRDHVVHAGVTILAANGIGTPRLLLLSATAGHPDGLANASGLVGKRLMMHPLGQVIGMWSDDVGSTHGVHGQHLHSLQFYETDTGRGFVRGAKWGLLPSVGPLTQTRSYPWGEANAIWGPRFHEELRSRLGHAAWWAVIAEDLPEERNRVTLDHSRTDDYGDPVAKLTYSTSANSRRLLDFHLARAVESFEAAGAARTIVGSWIKESGFHQLGTVKMGDDPVTSVVDGWGRAHDVENLYVLDGSTWPTSSGMNPTATVAALALRNTEALIRNRRSVAVAA